MKRFIFLLCSGILFSIVTFGQERKNIIALDPAQIFFNRYGIGYERLINNKSGVRLQLAFEKNVVEASLDYKFYLVDFGEGVISAAGVNLGTAVFRYYAGPAVLFFKEAKDLVFGPRLSTGLSWDFEKGMYFLLAPSVGYSLSLKDAPPKGFKRDYFWLNSGIGYKF